MNVIKELIKDCSGCIWYDDCEHQCTCDFYDSEEYEDYVKLDGYLKNMSERIIRYSKIVDELSDQ